MQFRNISTLQSHIVIFVGFDNISCLYAMYMFDSMFVLLALTPSAYGLSLMLIIMLTCPYNVYPLTPHFYIVKLGFTRVFIFFLFLL